MIEIKLSSDNCMTIIRSITVGNSQLSATYKNINCANTAGGGSYTINEFLEFRRAGENGN